MEEWTELATVEPAQESAILSEHSRVRLLGRLDIENGKIAVGAEGTIVYRYADGRTYEVEFLHPVHAIATLRREDLNPV